MNIPSIERAQQNYSLKSFSQIADWTGSFLL
jgi:hypothetical protein